jgi:hypothetical protein
MKSSNAHLIEDWFVHNDGRWAAVLATASLVAVRP